MSKVTECCTSTRLRIVLFVIIVLIVVQYGMNVFLFKSSKQLENIIKNGVLGENTSVNLNQLISHVHSTIFRIPSTSFEATKNSNSTKTKTNFTESTLVKNAHKDIPPLSVKQDVLLTSAVVAVNAVPSTTQKPRCPAVPPVLVGAIRVYLSDPPTITELRKSHPEVEPGGKWRPKDCIARHKVAIVIPFRDRDEHLRIFLWNMHPLLQKQQLDYAIFIVEQSEGSKFNRAMLMNIGFVEAMKLYDFQCFVFHDVDLLPEDDRNIYSCPEQPRHMSVAVDKFNYRLPYEDIFGGVSALSTEHMKKVNGFSNKFFGWGGEDDDMSNRIRHHGLHISRYPKDIAKYKMIVHKGENPSDDRFRYLNSGRQRFNTDGLNSLIYTRKKLELRSLYTWIYVDIDMEQVMRT